MSKQYVRTEALDLASEYQLDKYLIPKSMLEMYAKDVGLSIHLYKMIHTANPEAANSIYEACRKAKGIEFTDLLVDESGGVYGYLNNVEESRLPILNLLFNNYVISSVSDYLDVVENYYLDPETKSYVLLKRRTPLKIVPRSVEGTHSVEGTEEFEYSIGVLVTNDELYNVSCRLVLFIDDQPVYLPASQYSVTNTRYNKTTENSYEALQVVMLRVIEDLTTENLSSKLVQMHYMLEKAKSTEVTYEEYNTVLRELSKLVITAGAAEEDIAAVSSMIDDFEQDYPYIEEKRSSYIWRCSALSDKDMYQLVTATLQVLRKFHFSDVQDIRNLLGTYITTNRIATELAHRRR